MPLEFRAGDCLVGVSFLGQSSMQELAIETVPKRVELAVDDRKRRRLTFLQEDDLAPYELLARLAAQASRAPIAALVFDVDGHLQTKCLYGVDTGSVDLSPLVAHTLARDTQTYDYVDVLSASSSTALFADARGVQSYAGVAVASTDGDIFGALVVADTSEHERFADVDNLLDIARHLSAFITDRLRVVELDAVLERQRRDEEELKSQIEQIHGYSRELQVHAVRLEAINARLEALAKLDGMTGLKNHRAFQERLEFEFQRAMRYSMPLSLLLLDVDSFKQFNDTYGHLAGDEVLKTVAQVLQDNARGVDFVARYGGEEFVVILPHADEPASIAIGERLRAAIENVVWPLRSITASFGISTLSHVMTHASDLIALADKALYGSKTAGRNRVTHSIDMGNDAK